MSEVYSKARERIAAMDALAWSIAASATVAEAERKRRNQRERSPERKAYKKAYDGVGGPGHEGMLERSRRYKERHPERCKEKQKRHYEAHREKENERCRLWRRMKKILALATILTTCADSARPCNT
jgi:hypothetical protein